MFNGKPILKNFRNLLTVKITMYSEHHNCSELSIAPKILDVLREKFKKNCYIKVIDGKVTLTFYSNYITINDIRKNFLLSFDNPLELKTVDFKMEIEETNETIFKWNEIIEEEVCCDGN